MLADCSSYRSVGGVNLSARMGVSAVFFCDLLDSALSGISLTGTFSEEIVSPRLLRRAITSPALLHLDFASSTCNAGTPGYFLRSSIISDASLRSLIIKSMVALKSIHFDVSKTNHFPYFAKI